MTIIEPSPSRLPIGSSIPVLETARLTLRAPRIEDATAIATIANDKRIAQMTASLPHPYRTEDALAFVELAAAPQAIHLLVTLNGAQDDVLGAVGAAPDLEGVPTLGYWLGAPFWGQGYATEAAQALVDHLFATTDWPAIRGTTRVTNPASRRVLEKCGFQWTGAGLERIRSLASSVPVDRFVLERRNWTALKSWGRGTRERH